MLRLLRSGVLSFWLAVTLVMVVLGVWVATVAPATEPEVRPAISEMFDDAVDLRHQIAVAVRSGDTGPLADTAGALSQRWSADGGPDRVEARTAAAALLDRLAAEAGRPGPLDIERRDLITAEADLFAALAAGYDSAPVIAAATDGVTPSLVRPGEETLDAGDVDCPTRRRRGYAFTSADPGVVRRRPPGTTRSPTQRSPRRTATGVATGRVVRRRPRRATPGRWA